MMDESQYALASSSGTTAGRRWPTSISRTSLEDRSAAHLLTSDEAWRVAVNIAKLPDLLRGSPPLARRYEVAAAHSQCPRHVGLCFNCGRIVASR
jgi:hypothetical protein